MSKEFKPVRKAVFPVAGLGTRFLPATKVMPKEMLTINDRPLIQHVVQEAQEAGIEEFIFVTGRYKEMLEEHFDFQPELEHTLRSRGKMDMLDKVHSVEMPAGSLFLTRQPKPLGLGHAIWCAKKLVGDEPFAVLLPDVLINHEKGCLKQMVDVYNKHGGNIIAVEEVPEEETYKYGILDVKSCKEKVSKVNGMVEKPEPGMAPSNLSAVGRYILQPSVFDYLAAFERGAGNEIQLTDAMAKQIGKEPFHSLRFDGRTFDCGGRIGFIEANMAYGLQDPSIAEELKEIIKRYA